MLGTIVNSLVVILGSLIGVFLKKGINEKYQNTLIDSISLAVVIIGIMGSIKSENLVLVIVSLAIGSLIGEKVDIEGKLNSWVRWQKKGLERGIPTFKGLCKCHPCLCVGLWP